MKRKIYRSRGLGALAPSIRQSTSDDVSTVTEGRQDDGRNRYNSAGMIYRPFGTQRAPGPATRVIQGRDAGMSDTDIKMRNLKQIREGLAPDPRYQNADSSVKTAQNIQQGFAQRDAQRTALSDAHKMKQFARFSSFISAQKPDEKGFITLDKETIGRLPEIADGFTGINNPKEIKVKVENGRYQLYGDGNKLKFMSPRLDVVNQAARFGDVMNQQEMAAVQQSNIRGLGGVQKTGKEQQRMDPKDRYEFFKEIDENNNEVTTVFDREPEVGQRGRRLDPSEIESLQVAQRREIMARAKLDAAAKAKQGNDNGNNEPAFFDGLLSSSRSNNQQPAAEANNAIQTQKPPQQDIATNDEPIDINDPDISKEERRAYYEEKQRINRQRRAESRRRLMTSGLRGNNRRRGR